MVRAPCCEKMGVNRGPWKPEEDEILISYIHKHGHGNWRALPKQAGLLRCGKSCRLRWTNYLRPDIKRGNFTKEEEETIIKLHEKLGNRWSTIAARLPGRTDNEIKNVWHTNLKKQVKHYEPSPKRRASKLVKATEPPNCTTTTDTTTPAPQEESSSEISSLTDYSSAENKASNRQTKIKHEGGMNSSEYLPQIDESFWSEEQLSSEIVIKHEEMESQELPTDYSATSTSHKNNNNNVCTSKIEEDMDFWFNLFIKSGDIPEFP